MRSFLICSEWPAFQIRSNENLQEVLQVFIQVSNFQRNKYKSQKFIILYSKKEIISKVEKKNPLYCFTTIFFAGQYKPVWAEAEA